MFDAFGTAMMVTVVYLAALFAVLIVRRGRCNAARLLFINLSVLYLLVLACVTLLPVSDMRERRVSLIPFVGMLLNTPTGYVFRTGFFFRYWITSLLNVLLFLPFGVLLFAQLTMRGVRRKFWLVVAFSLAVSLLVELLQLALPFGRVFDVDDLIFNTLGGACGAGVFALLLRYPAFRRILEKIMQKERLP